MRRSETELLAAVYRRSGAIRRRRRVIAATGAAFAIAVAATVIPGVDTDRAHDVDTVDTVDSPSTTAPPAVVDPTAVPARQAGERAPAPPAGGGGGGAAGPSPATQGQAAPDGAAGQIAFVTFDNGTVWVVNADGTALRQLAAGSPSWWPVARWSPDGTQIAFVSGPRAQLTVIGADGTGRRELSNAPRSAADPRWSPDGTRIAYLSLDGVPEPYLTYSPLMPVGVGPSDDVELAVTGMDGSGERLLTVTEHDHERSPIWSPNGRRIAFFRYGTRLSWHTIGADGIGDTLAWDSPTEWISWSPDGAWWVAAAANNPDDPADDAIVLVRPDGSEVREVVRAPAASWPVWSPTGETIAFVQRLDSGWILRVVALDGTALAAIDDDVTQPPSWSPDGRFLTYCNPAGLRRAGADGSEPVLLAAISWCWAPEWSPR